MRNTQLEDRLRAGFDDLKTIDLDTLGDRPRPHRQNHRTAVRTTAAALVGVGLLASGIGWKSTQQARLTVTYGAGAATTPADDVLAIDWNRGFLEDQLGTSSGSASSAIANAIHHAETGCTGASATPRSALLATNSDAKSMTQRTFVETFGLGYVEVEPKPQEHCGDATRPVPVDVRSALVEVRAAESNFAQLPEVTDLRRSEAKCHQDHGDSGDQLFGISQEIETHLEAVGNGTYEGLEELKERERELARIDFLCKSGDYSGLQKLQLRQVADIFSDPLIRQHLDAAKIFILDAEH